VGQQIVPKIVPRQLTTVSPVNLILFGC